MGQLSEIHEEIWLMSPSEKGKGKRTRSMSKVWKKHLSIPLTNITNQIICVKDIAVSLTYLSQLFQIWVGRNLAVVAD